ncbi:MAG: TrpR-related protein YerC/YecD [Clostridia bacterium]|nr:TrpR-related protein YerC/YecD [Clostridia bacterium]MDE7079485.1 TrpR-related protein YerC/YecD [Clostridia bacterium]
MNAEHNHLLIQQLIKTIASIQNEDDCRRFFDDLCTNKEIEQMAQRWQAAKLLNQGLTYNQVIEQTDISSATLSRVSRALQYGEGYKRMFKDENK